MYCYKEFIFLAFVSPTNVERLENRVCGNCTFVTSHCQLGLSPEAV